MVSKCWYFYFETWVGNFELDLTSHLFYKCITVVSTVVLLYHMYGISGLFVFSLPRTLISGRVRLQNITSYVIYYS